MNDVTLAEVSTVRLKLSFFVKYTAGIGDTVDFGCVVNVLFVCVSSLIILTVIEDVRSFEVKFDACARDIYSICRPPKPRSTWHILQVYEASLRRTGIFLALLLILREPTSCCCCCEEEERSTTVNTWGKKQLIYNVEIVLYMYLYL